MNRFTDRTIQDDYTKGLLELIKSKGREPVPQRDPWGDVLKSSPSLDSIFSSPVRRTLVGPGSEPGASLVGTYPQEAIDLISAPAAARDFQVIVPAGSPSFPNITGLPYAIALKPAGIGAQLLDEASMVGAGVSSPLGEIRSAKYVAVPVLEDNPMAGPMIMEALGNGAAQKLDFCAFIADGGDDETDGGWTGIFSDANVPTVSANSGQTSFASMTIASWCKPLSAVPPVALQRGCRWWLSPALIPTLLQIHDDVGARTILTPSHAPGGEWSILGHPVTWVSVAPSSDGADKPLAVFGLPAAYAVALRRDVQIVRTDRGPGFDSNLVMFQAIVRCAFLMRDASSFCILKTAAA